MEWDLQNKGKQRPEITSYTFKINFSAFTKIATFGTTILFLLLVHFTLFHHMFVLSTFQNTFTPVASATMLWRCSSNLLNSQCFHSPPFRGKSVHAVKFKYVGKLCTSILTQMERLPAQGLSATLHISLQGCTLSSTRPQ